jgi:hypothetical protein
MIDATRREMERAFRFHAALMGVCANSSQRLLLAYSVECGLKALIMRNERAELASALRYPIEHDLRAGLAQLRAPRNLKIRDVKTLQKAPQDIHPKNLHQAFRYGVNVNDDEVINELRAIAEWIRQRLL